MRGIEQILTDSLTDVAYQQHQSDALLSVVGLGRFELPTPRLSSVCSDQLSYRPKFKTRDP